MKQIKVVKKGSVKPKPDLNLSSPSGKKQLPY